MADSVALVRGGNGKITSPQRKKLIRALGNMKLSTSNKAALVRWITPQPQVTALSKVETALNAVHALTPLW